MPKKHSDDCGCHPNRSLQREGFWCGCSDRTGGFGIRNAFPDLRECDLTAHFSVGQNYCLDEQDGSCL